jgi:hypothetical protein
MKTAKAAFGLLFIWLGSLEWCHEYWHNMWPSTIPVFLPAIGALLVLWAAIQKSDWKPIALGLAALIPPFILLALRGFNV